MGAFFILAGKLENVFSGTSDYGPFTVLQMLLTPSKGRHRFVDVKVPDGIDAKQFVAGDSWQLPVDVNPPRREGNGLSIYLRNDPDARALMRKFPTDTTPTVGSKSA
ncbi:MAG: hypothetical protein KDJ47_08530 [Hyphomicrobiaceae bacterium]|nr:hypothetical protein [Hyphomicrobiaceae bacterium]